MRSWTPSSQFIEIGAKTHHGQKQAGVEIAAAAQQQQQQQQQEVKSEAKADKSGGAGGWPTKGDTVHIAYTSNGSPYTNFQVGATLRTAACQQ